MIVNILNSERHIWLKNTFRFFKVFYFDLVQRRVRSQLFQDAKKLKSFFQTNYPKLSKDNNSNLLCVSCDLCQTVCPTNAIEIKKANMINFPKSLTSGESPMHFYLDVTQCIKCSECSDVCLVGAIELTGKYNADKVDLVVGKTDS